MATLNSFNPVGSFQKAKSNALSLQAQQQGLNREAAAAPNRNALNDLNLQQAKVGAARKDTEFSQTQAFQSAKILNNAFKALRGIAPENRINAAQSLAPQLAQFGITQQFAIEDLEDAALDQDIAESSVFLQDQKNTSAGQRERNDLIKAVTPALNAQGQIDVSKLDANSRSAAMALGLIPKSGTVTGQERIAQTPGLSTDVATSSAEIKQAEETGKLTAQKGLLPDIRAAIKLAEKGAVSKGEASSSLNASKAALPGLRKVVSNLKALSGEATFTLAGKGFNAIAKELGFSTKGDTARSAMIAMVDNQVLPLLKPIFGAAFTAIEGDRLRNAFLDPDSTPDSRVASLDAFLAQMERNIETKEAELNMGSEQQGANGGGGQIMIDANGNRARVFPDGSFEEL